MAASGGQPPRLPFARRRLRFGLTARGVLGGLGDSPRRAQPLLDAGQIGGLCGPATTLGVVRSVGRKGAAKAVTVQGHGLRGQHRKLLPDEPAAAAGLSAVASSRSR